MAGKYKIMNVDRETGEVYWLEEARCAGGKLLYVTWGTFDDADFFDCAGTFENIRNELPDEYLLPFYCELEPKARIYWMNSSGMKCYVGDVFESPMYSNRKRAETWDDENEADEAAKALGSVFNTDFYVEVGE